MADCESLSLHGWDVWEWKTVENLKHYSERLQEGEGRLTGKVLQSLMTSAVNPALGLARSAFSV
jgi:hypothetical protein